MTEEDLLENYMFSRYLDNYDVINMNIGRGGRWLNKGE